MPQDFPTTVGKDDATTPLFAAILFPNVLVPVGFRHDNKVNVISIFKGKPFSMYLQNIVQLILPVHYLYFQIRLTAFCCPCTLYNDSKFKSKTTTLHLHIKYKI